MKTTPSLTRFVITRLGIAALFLSTRLTSSAEDKAPKDRERIGVFDSRAVAVAYASSKFLKQEIQELTTQHKKAIDARDEKEKARLEAEGQALQAKLHQQGFSTTPVDNLLTQISGELSKIRQAAGISVIVSKWDNVRLDKHPLAEKVDVTMQLVDAFHPNERGRDGAIEIQSKAPVPIDQLSKHP